MERLGAETIDGRTAEGFRIQLGAIDVKIWADPKTLLPIRVEETTEAADGPKVSIVMTDFQVNVPLDESLFSVDVPPGYTVQQTMQIDASKSPWAYLADALKMAAEYNDGVFPPALRGEQGIDGIMQRAATTLVEKHGKGSPRTAEAIEGCCHEAGGSLRRSVCPAARRLALRGQRRQAGHARTGPFSGSNRRRAADVW